MNFQDYIASQTLGNAHASLMASTSCVAFSAFAAVNPESVHGLMRDKPCALCVDAVPNNSGKDASQAGK